MNWKRLLPLLFIPQFMGRMGYGRLEAQDSATQGLSIAAIAARATPATVTILAFDADGDTLGQGSGFLVRASGVIVTNWHVLAGAQNATVILSTGERYNRVMYLDGDSAQDVALVQIAGSGLPFLTVRSDIPPAGSRVVVIGSPLGLSRTVTDGLVSAKRVVEGRELVQVSAPVSHGSSGAPVLDSRGRVFAIASSFLAEGQQLNFAVPVRYAIGLLALQPSPQSLETSPVGVASGAGEGGVSTNASATLWSPARAQAPRATLEGTYSGFRWFQHTSSDGKKNPAMTDIDQLVVTDSGHGWRGFSCDSLGICKSVHYAVLRTAPSGDVVLDLGYVALDGYQADTGFVVHGQYVSTSIGGTIELWIRGWKVAPPLSRRSGLYRCSARTQYINRDYRGDFTDWNGQAAVLETSDSSFVQITLVNSNGGSTGAAFAEPHASGNDFSAVETVDQQTLKFDGRWSFGALSGNWTDTRKRGARFEGPLTCNRI